MTQPMTQVQLFDNGIAFITGPSRTADIELTMTPGVHGPKEWFVWMVVV
ncbi:MAG: LUD domain-containing protein [Chloroflexota bacterium]